MDDVIKGHINDTRFWIKELTVNWSGHLIMHYVVLTVERTESNQQTSKEQY